MPDFSTHSKCPDCGKPCRTWVDDHDCPGQRPERTSPPKASLFWTLTATIIAVGGITAMQHGYDYIAYVLHSFALAAASLCYYQEVD